MGVDPVQILFIAGRTDGLSTGRRQAVQQGIISGGVPGKPAPAHLPGTIIHQQIEGVFPDPRHHRVVQVIPGFQLADPRILLLLQRRQRSITLLTLQIHPPGILA
ncbi:hypothetical protein D3C79_942920 [compost metagenome]